MTLYSPHIILDSPPQKKNINDYEITLTVKNSVLNIYIQNINDFIYYESTFRENELQQKFNSNLTINYIFDDICNLIDKKKVQIEENKQNIKLIFSSNDLFTELIIDISLKKVYELIEQFNYKTNIKDFTIISLLILVIFFNCFLLTEFIINNNSQENNIKLINTKINEFNEKKMLEINKTIIKNINEEFQKTKTNELNKNLDISQINETIGKINIEITEINKSIHELNNINITNNQFDELKENILNETNNKIEQFNEIINTKINSINYDFTITTLTNTKKIDSLKDINSMVVFPSKKIAFVSDNYTITLLDENLNVLANSAKIHDGIIYDINNFDENNFVTCSSDKTIKTWNKNNDKIELVNTIANAHERTIFKVIYNPKGDIISCAKDNKIKIWELKNNQYKNINLLDHSREVNSILLLEDKNILISSGYGIKFWDLTNNNLIFSNDNIKTIWHSGLEKINNDKIIVCNNNTSFMIYSISDLKVKLIKEIQIDYSCVSVKSIEKKNIFIIGSLNKIYIYRNDNYKLIQIIDNSHSKKITKINELTDDSIITSSYDRTIKTWFIKTIYVEKISNYMN